LFACGIDDCSYCYISRPSCGRHSAVDEAAERHPPDHSGPQGYAPTQGPSVTPQFTPAPPHNKPAINPNWPCSKPLRVHRPSGDRQGAAPHLLRQPRPTEDRGRKKGGHPPRNANFPVPWQGLPLVDESLFPPANIIDVERISFRERKGRGKGSVTRTKTKSSCPLNGFALEA